VYQLVITIMTMLAYALLAYAEIAPHQGVESLPQLFNSASVVLTGEVVSVEPTGEVDGVWYEQAVRLERFTAQVSVNREYKGPPNLGSVAIIFTRPSGTLCAVSRCEALQVGDEGLFFVKQESDGYHLLDPRFGRLPASRLKSAGARPGIGGLQSDIVAGLHDSDEKRLLANVDLYGALEQVPTSPLLELLQMDNRDLVRAATHVALLKLGDHPRLTDAAIVAELHTDDPLELLFQEEICSFIGEIRDRTTVQVLLGFSHSRSDRLRQSVIHALREMGSADAVPVFVEALDDRLELIRYDAVLGLATVEKNWQLAPSIDSFVQDESKYISSWKSWWLTTGKLSYR